MKGKVIAAWIAILLAAAVAIGGAWQANVDWHDAQPTSQPWAERGQRGDFWGGHLAAAAGVVSAFLFLAALLYQMQEMHESSATTREHSASLREQGSALKAQAAALEAQQRELAAQNELLKAQNLLTENRNEVEAIFRFAKFEGDHRRSINSQSWKIGLQRVVRLALIDRVRGMDLLETLVGVVCVSVNTDPFVESVRAIADHAKLDEKHETWPYFERWTDVADRIVKKHLAVDWRTNADLRAAKTVMDAITNKSGE